MIIHSAYTVALTQHDPSICYGFFPFVGLILVILLLGINWILFKYVVTQTCNYSFTQEQKMSQVKADAHCIFDTGQLGVFSYFCASKCNEFKSEWKPSI